MIRKLPAGLALVTLLGAHPVLPAQDLWTGEQLEEQMKGFKANDTSMALHTLSVLLKKQKAGLLAICNRIHGNHAEYLLRIEKLLDDLSNERWQVREQAEKTLVEIGAKARDLIQARSKAAETAEEQIRATRVNVQIGLRDNEKEKTEARYIRGLALTALFMDPEPRLTKALVSALQHTDPVIVTRCIRALGRHGGDAEAGKLIDLLRADSISQAQTVHAALARMDGTKGRDYIVEAVASGKLAETPAVQLTRILRERQDGPVALTTLTKAKNQAVARAAALSMPASQAAPLMVEVGLADQTRVQGHLLGYVGDSLHLASPVIARGEEKEPIDVPELTFPLNRCDGIKIVGAKAKEQVEVCRLFLVQGTLVTGTLEAVTAEKVIFESATFGRMEVERARVQGLAIDPKLDRLLGASNKHDKVRLQGNKFIAGKILSYDGKGLAFEDENGKAHTAEPKEVAGLLFKRPLQTTVDNRTFTRVVLKNGDRVLGHIAAITKSHVGVVAPGIDKAVIPMSHIVEMEFGMGGGAMWGFTLVADYSDNRIVEFDDQGNEVFSIEEIFGVWDVECLDNGNLLITEFSVNRVSEVTRKNEVVWSFEDLKNPYDADRLPNGNTLIADTFGRRVIEVNKKGKIVWLYEKDIHPYDTDRLPNGNTLIADTHDDRVIEVTREGKIVWQIKNVPNVHDADRLPNGNTLLTIRMLNEVREVDPSGKTVMAIKDLSSPSDADRLPNGNTIVAENGFVREFDRHGNEVKKKPITWAVEVNRY